MTERGKAIFKPRLQGSYRRAPRMGAPGYSGGCKLLFQLQYVRGGERGA